MYSVMVESVRLFVVQNDCVQCHGGESQVVCGSEYITVDILCGQRHRVVPLNP